MPAAQFAGRCVNPRSGTDPTTGQPYVDIRGAAVDENNWLRSYSNDLYLWYSEIVDRDPGLYATPDYFNLLKTTRTEPSGSSVDRFHFTYSTSDWVALQQSGTEAGYGAEWSVLSSQPPRRIVVAYTQPGSPAAAPGVNLQRGEEIAAIDTVDINTNTQAGIDTLNNGLFPDQLNETHTFAFRNPQTGTQRTVTMQSAQVTIDPVQNVRTVATNTGLVGYIQFTDHLPSSEQQLIDAFTSFAQQSVTDLVLDLRYNGGGLLFIASEVAYMIAGPVPTANGSRTFERLVFNDKHQAINPVTLQALMPMPFFDDSSTGQPLPTLNLSRVYLLTGSGTCSASESIINGLRGVGVQVIQIGSKTCGKPYGFYPKDNCGTTYFTIQFKGTNEAGFGDYGDGFVPNNSFAAGGVRVPGCSVRDDFTRALGDPLEERFAAALSHRSNQATCPAPSGKSAPMKSFEGSLSLDKQSGETGDGIVDKSPWLTNRWLGRP